MSPLPLNVPVIFARSVKSSRLPFLIMTRSVNDLRNPDFIRSPLSVSDPRFLRLIDLIEILSGSIDVSKEHRESGLAIKYPAPGLAGQEVRILRAGPRPRNASVAVKYRQAWFYIDETDQSTKLMFRVLRTLWKDRIASTAQLQHAPVLTIPVSR